MPKAMFLIPITLCLMGLSIGIAYGGVVGLWLLDEGSGQIASDSSGNGNNGKLTGSIKWSNKGKIKGCIEGDGSIGWVEIPNSKSLTRGAGPFTVMAWVKTNAVAQYGIFAKSADAPVAHQDWGLYVWDGKMRFAGNWPEAWTAEKFTSKGDVIAGKWIHLAVAWGAEKLLFYIDGKLDVEFSWVGPFKDTDIVLTIGADPAGGDEPINGLIDEVAMFDQALSNEDIQKAMSGLETFLSIESVGKLSISWGSIKKGFSLRKK